MFAAHGLALDAVHALVAQGESQTLELKKSTAEKYRACRTLCAMANGQGGVVVFGVTPAGKLVGQQVTDRTLEELAQEFQGFEPPLFPVVERKVVAEADGKRLELLWVQVDKARHAPVSFRGVPYERVLNTTRVMPRTAYQRLLLESLHGTARWETEPAPGWTAAQLDQAELITTLDEAIRRGRTEDPGTRDALQILKGLGLVLRDGQLSRAAVALFCPVGQPLPDFPQLKLRVARFKGTDRSEFADNRQYWGNAFALMRQAERFLLDWLPVAGKVLPNQLARADTPALPTEAVREALANAFVHRDYASGAGSVAVALFDDRLEIISSGELHFGLTPEMLFQPHESKPWNPLMAHVFYRRGLIETWGRGTLKMADLLQEAGLPPPVLREQHGFVTLTFALQNKFEAPKTPGKVSGETSVEMSVEMSGETPVKVPDLLLAWLARQPSTTVPELAKRLGRSDRGVERVLRKLREEGRLIRVGPTKGGHWQVVATQTKDIE